MPAPSQPRRRGAQPGIAADSLLTAASYGAMLRTETVMMLGGQCALLLQISHPVVGAAVAANSDLSAPYRRLHRTITALDSICFGSAEQRERWVRRLDTVHTRLQGEHGGVAYDGKDPDASAWVLATLAYAMLEVERRWLGWFDEPMRDGYLAEWITVAGLLGVPASLMPATAAQLRAEIPVRAATFDPPADVRAVGRTVLAPSVRSVRMRGWRDVAVAAAIPAATPLMRLSTWDLLPPCLHGAYGLTSRVPASALAGAAGLAQAASRAALPFTPKAGLGRRVAARLQSLEG